MDHENVFVINFFGVQLGVFLQKSNRILKKTSSLHRHFRLDQLIKTLIDLLIGAQIEIF